MVSSGLLRRENLKSYNFTLVSITQVPRNIVTLNINFNCNKGEVFSEREQIKSILIPVKLLT
jgi:hypothetical protein